ncbi:hypothetical protein OIV42_32565, partial [Burkholderia pseudomallei]|nr:hypothetical protein [Burkholderia pseudomallei]
MQRHQQLWIAGVLQEPKRDVKLASVWLACGAIASSSQHMLRLGVDIGVYRNLERGTDPLRGRAILGLRAEQGRGAARPAPAACGVDFAGDTRMRGGAG